MQPLIREFIRSLIFRDFSPQEKLVSDRVIDSVNLVELTLFLEEHFAVQISPREMNAENFDSLEAIEQLIVKKQSTSGSTAP
jgi:acyl carrier protein